MIPLLVPVISFAVLRGAGLLGITVLNNLELPLRIALCLMFLLTASAHWGRGRPDLIRMVPPAFSNAGLLVAITGVLEILGAIGLPLPWTARLAAGCLAILLLALFPPMSARHGNASRSWDGRRQGCWCGERFKSCFRGR